MHTKDVHETRNTYVLKMSANPKRFPCLYTSGIEFHKRTLLIHAPYFEPRLATQNRLTGGKTGTDELGKTPSYAGRRVKPKPLAPPRLSTAARVETSWPGNLLTRDPNYTRPDFRKWKSSESRSKADGQPSEPRSWIIRRRIQGWNAKKKSTKRARTSDDGFLDEGPMIPILIETSSQEGSVGPRGDDDDGDDDVDEGDSDDDDGGRKSSDTGEGGEGGSGGDRQGSGSGGDREEDDGDDEERRGSGDSAGEKRFSSDGRASGSGDRKASGGSGGKGSGSGEGRGSAGDGGLRASTGDYDGGDGDGDGGDDGEGGGDGDDGDKDGDGDEVDEGDGGERKSSDVKRASDGSGRRKSGSGSGGDKETDLGIDRDLFGLDMEDEGDGIKDGDGDGDDDDGGESRAVTFTDKRGSAEAEAPAVAPRKTWWRNPWRSQTGAIQTPVKWAAPTDSEDKIGDASPEGSQTSTDKPASVLSDPDSLKRSTKVGFADVIDRYADDAASILSSIAQRRSTAAGRTSIKSDEEDSHPSQRSSIARPRPSLARRGSQWTESIHSDEEEGLARRSVAGRRSMAERRSVADRRKSAVARDVTRGSVAERQHQYQLHDEKQRQYQTEHQRQRQQPNRGRKIDGVGNDQPSDASIETYLKNDDRMSAAFAAMPEAARKRHQQIKNKKKQEQQQQRFSRPSMTRRGDDVNDNFIGDSNFNSSNRNDVTTFNYKEALRSSRYCKF